MTNKFKISDRVTRDTMNRSDDRKLHRIGEIIEFNETAGRARVLWTEEGNGSEIINARGGRGLRTWVKLTTLYKA